MASAQMKLLILRLFSGSQEDFRRWFKNQMKHADKVKLVFTPNPEQVVLFLESESFRSCLEQGDVLLADGAGLVIAARLWGRSLTRITGVDTLTWWLEEGNAEKVPTLLIGGRSGVAEFVAKKYDPEGQWCWGIEGHANVAAAHDSAFQEQFQAEEKVLFDIIRQKKPRVIFVAFGAPWQEEFLCRHRAELEKLGVRVAVVCGGSFDYVAGMVPRAPQWMRSIGLEWLYRLKVEPWRWRRQLKLVKFLKLLFR